MAKIWLEFWGQTGGSRRLGGVDGEIEMGCGERREAYPFPREEWVWGGSKSPPKKKNLKWRVSMHSGRYFCQYPSQKMLNLLPEVVIWWRLKVYFWEIMNTLLES